MYSIVYNIHVYIVYIYVCMYICMNSKRACDKVAVDCVLWSGVGSPVALGLLHRLSQAVATLSPRYMLHFPCLLRLPEGGRGGHADSVINSTIFLE